jgi:hypothetical protein
MIVLSLLLVGSTCFYLEGIPAHKAIIGFGKNTNLMALFILIPLIGTFMSTAGYLSALRSKVQKREQIGEQHLIFHPLLFTNNFFFN